MYNNYTVLKDKFLYIEEKYDLLNWKVDNLFAWQIIRPLIYNILWNFNSPSNVIESVNNSTLINKLLSTFKFLALNLFKNPFFDFRQKNILIFESTRSATLQGNIIDPYVYPILDIIDKSSYSFYGSPSKKTEINKYVFKDIRLLRLYNKYFSKYLHVKFSNYDLDLIQSIEREVFKNFGIEINVKKLIELRGKSFKVDYFLYSNLLRIKRPIEIWIVSHNNNQALIHAAKKRRCLINEIQHGLIGYEDLIYHYPKTKEGTLEYFPDTFYFWDKKYYNLSKLPLTSDKLKIISNKYLLEKAKLFQKITKKKQIIIASQPDNIYNLASFLNKNLKYFKNYRIIFKLHPADKITMETNNLLEILIRDGVEVVTKSADIHILLAESICVISVYSTVVIEALYFDCKVWLLSLPGIEMMKGYEDEKTKLITESTSITELINELTD